MFKRALLAQTALAGFLVSPAGYAVAADYSEATFNGGGTLAGSSTDSLTISNGGAVANSSDTATVVLTNTGSSGNTLSITNNGTIHNDAGDGRAIDMNSKTNVSTVTITVGSSGVISSGDDAIRVNKALTSGSSLTIDNAGTISSSSGQALDLKGMTTAGATTTIINRASGIISSQGADVIRPGVGANITNYGVICAGTYGAAACHSTGSESDGVDVQGNSGVTVTNKSGALISGDKHGVTGDEGVTVINEAGASLIGRNGSGVNIDNTDFDAVTGAVTATRSAATVTNYGLISGDYAGSGDGDGDGVDVDGIATVTNYGTIRGTGAGGVDSGGQPNHAEGIAMGGGIIDNKAGATIYGASAGILVDNGSGGSGVGATTITNAGTIQGGDSYAIKLVGVFDDSLTSTGNLKAGGGGNVVDMGAGNDTVTINGGTVSGGDIDGGEGTDGITFFDGTTGSITLDGGLLNFETAQFKNGLVVIRGALDASQSVEIGAGAKVQPNQSFSTASLVVNGTLLAAENQGLRTITTATYTQGAGGVLEVRVAGSAGHDSIDVSGTATLADGATIRPVSTGYIGTGTTYRFLTSSTLDADIQAITVDSASPLLTWSLTEDGTDMVLTATRSQSLSTVGSGGGAAAGRVLEQIATGGSSDMQAVIAAVQNQPTLSAIGSSLKELGPAPSGGVVQGTMSAGTSLTNTVQTRMAAVRSGQSVGTVAQTPVAAPSLALDMEQGHTFDRTDASGPLLGMATGSAPTQAGIWVQGFGANANQGARDDTEGFKSRTAGFAVGGDMPLDGRTILGFAGSFARTFVDGRGLQDQDRNTIDSYQMTIYGTRTYGASFLEGSLVGGYNTYDSRRAIAFLGRTADADYQGWQGLAKVTAGHDYPLDGVTLAPVTSLQYAHTHLESYTETGAGAASLAVDGQDYDTLTPGIGLRVGLAPIALDRGSLTPQMSANLTYDVVTDRQSVTSSFVGGGSAFVSDGADPARTAFNGTMGVSYRVDDVEISAGYQLDLRQQYVGHAAVIRLRQDL